MDSIKNINPDSDSSFILMMEAQKRGHIIYYYNPSELYLLEGQVLATARTVKLSKDKNNFYSLGYDETINLKDDIDIVLMRQDPPFNMEYITATHILDHLYPKTLVINDPFEVRNAPEKLLITHFSGLTPPTLISEDDKIIKNFYEQHRNIIIKPLYDCGGSNIFHIDESGKNFNALLNILKQTYKEPIIAQKFIPEAKNQGDRRIIMIDGKAAGVFLRVPADDEIRSNLALGGKAEKWEMTDRDQEICDIIGPELAKRGLVFAGLDVIGDYITEINITSPTGLQTINEMYGECLEAKLWNAFEKRYEDNLNK